MKPGVYDVEVRHTGGRRDHRQRNVSVSGASTAQDILRRFIEAGGASRKARAHEYRVRVVDRAGRAVYEASLDA